MAYVSTDLVAAEGTPEDARLEDQGMVPLGAAVWTGSGRLAERGITAIVHAASGAMGRTAAGYDPTMASVTASIANAANMEVVFGGGISGVIGAATGNPAAIDEEAARAVAGFWTANTAR